MSDESDSDHEQLPLLDLSALRKLPPEAASFGQEDEEDDRPAPPRPSKKKRQVKVRPQLRSRYMASSRLAAHDFTVEEDEDEDGDDQNDDE